MTVRKTYAEYLEETDQEISPLGYICPCCNITGDAITIVKTVPEDNIEHVFACGTCLEDKKREDAQNAPPPVGLTEEDINGMRAERGFKLLRSDWIEFPANRARHTTGYVAAMDQYRVDLHTRFDRAVAEQALPSEEDPWPYEPLTTDFS